MSYAELAPTNGQLKRLARVVADPLSAVAFVRETLGMPEAYDDPKEFLLEVEEQGLSSLLYKDIRRSGSEHLFSGEILGSLKVSYMKAAMRSAVLFSELEVVLDAFQKAAIPAILLKGAHLAGAIYEDSALRSMEDVDLLVKAGDFARAQEVLVSLGYVLDGECAWNELDRNRTGHTYVKSAPPRVHIEIHNNPHHGYRTGDYSRFDLQGIWERASPVRIGGANALGMSPEDLLLFLSWHYRFHYFSKLIWLYDIGVILQRHGNIIDWPGLMASAHWARLDTTLYYCLQLASMMLKAPLCIDGSVKLQPPYVARKLVPYVLRMGGSQVLSAPEHRLLRVALQHLMVHRNLDLLRLAGGLLFPSKVALGSRYVRNDSLRLKFVRFYYLIHPFSVLKNGLRGGLILFRQTKPTGVKPVGGRR